MSEKICFKCQTSKPYSEFYKHRMMADGHLNKCISCVKEYERIRLIKLNADPVWKEKELARSREKSARYRAIGKRPDALAMKKSRDVWVAKNKHKKQAHMAVSNALRAGKIERNPCEVCGEMKVHAHHDDYSKPLDIKWLCVKHHNERHLELNKMNRYQLQDN